MIVGRISAVLASVSLVCASSMAAAAPVIPAQAPSAWSTLAFLNGGQSAAAYCGATAVGAAGAAAAQGAPGCVLPQLDPVAPPVVEQQLPPPLPGAAAGVSVSAISPLVIALGALAAAAAAYFLIKGLDKSNNDNSPA